MSGGKHYSSSVVPPPAVMWKLPLPLVTKGAKLSATALVGVLGDTATIAAAAAAAAGEGVAMAATAAAEAVPSAAAAAAVGVAAATASAASEVLHVSATNKEATGEEARGKDKEATGEEVRGKEVVIRS